MVKDANQFEPIKFIPDGVWESSKPDGVGTSSKPDGVGTSSKPNTDDEQCTPSTDLHGNGYPDKQQG